MADSVLHEVCDTPSRCLPDGTRWVCPVCELIWEHTCDAAQGCVWSTVAPNTPTEARRIAMCRELGLPYSIVISSGPALARLDRLIALRDAVPRGLEENLALLQKIWAQRARAVQ